MEALTKDQLKRYRINLEKQKAELEHELHQIKEQVVEVRGAIRWITQIIDSLPS